MQVCCGSLNDGLFSERYTSRQQHEEREQAGCHASFQLLQITLSGQTSQPGTSKSPAHVYLILFQVCDRIATWAEF